MHHQKLEYQLGSINYGGYDVMELQEQFMTVQYKIFIKLR